VTLPCDYCALTVALAAWMAGTSRQDRICLICSRQVRKQTAHSIACLSCPRNIHHECLERTAPHARNTQYCPLCIKRRWHLIRPETPIRQDGRSEDDLRMKRIRRYKRWHRYNDEHIRAWSKLQDDGSWASARRLLVDMGVVSHGKLQVTATKSEDIPSEAAPTEDDSGVGSPSGVSRPKRELRERIHQWLKH
jgi:hypothetical protein